MSSNKCSIKISHPNGSGVSCTGYIEEYLSFVCNAVQLVLLFAGALLILARSY
jgi:hypothetical protein